MNDITTELAELSDQQLRDIAVDLVVRMQHHRDEIDRLSRMRVGLGVEIQKRPGLGITSAFDLLYPELKAAE